MCDRRTFGAFPAEPFVVNDVVGPLHRAACAIAAARMPAAQTQDSRRGSDAVRLRLDLRLGR